MFFGLTLGQRITRFSILIVGIGAGGLVLANELETLDTVGDGERGFDCRELADRPAPESASDWFERSLWANHCYVFRARAVRISSSGVRTLALSHDVQEGVEREVARFLDGPPVVHERRGRIGRGTWTQEGERVPASPTAIMAHIEEHYRLSLGGEERIAGRSTVRLDVEPLDSMRYGHRLWLDRDSALPLKQMLIDTDGRVLETFQMTDLERPTLYDGYVVLDEPHEPPTDPWQPGWLPPGYVAQPVITSSSVHDAEVGHRLFSDGLSSLSLFVEPLDGDNPLLAPGMHRLGISFAAVRHMELGGQPMQVVVMGEVPPQVLLRVVEQVEWRPDQTASSTTTEASP
ncbi:MucB/RseB C-terminal domain-containing protein [Litchfieldella rifensis]|uniref:MucB/RseB C-terminal domain-containing protein n=1 Tax=Litchfieldella rifensis TaxID=762643 RepID=A0ABV7LMY1_9GAMM